MKLNTITGGNPFNAYDAASVPDVGSFKGAVCQNAIRFFESMDVDGSLALRTIELIERYAFVHSPFGDWTYTIDNEDRGILRLSFYHGAFDIMEASFCCVGGAVDKIYLSFKLPFRDVAGHDGETDIQKSVNVCYSFKVSSLPVDRISVTIFALLNKFFMELKAPRLEG